MANKICYRVLVCCVGACFVTAAYAADTIVTGAHLSQETRAKIVHLKPASTFESQPLPSAPDYAASAAWAALPGRLDSADFIPANTKYPEAQASAPADVFFIHPTTTTGAINNWNIPIDDPITVQDLDGILAACASTFNAAAKVYAPRYREAALYAFFDDQTTSGIKAVELAYHDVERAFLYYIEQYNRGRPFILAGHSQGSIHGLRLLQEHIIGTPLAERMVAAYLIGGTVPQDIPDIQPSRAATDTGVVIGWNTYTNEGDGRIFTDGLISWIKGSYTTLRGRAMLQTNPLSWELHGTAVPAAQNPGSLIDSYQAGALPALVSAVCGTDASGALLRITTPSVPGFTLPATFDSPLFNTRFGDYHCFDYQLFYESIRKNALDRVRVFLKDV